MIRHHVPRECIALDPAKKWDAIVTSVSRVRPLLLIVTVLFCIASAISCVVAHPATYSGYSGSSGIRTEPSGSRHGLRNIKGKVIFSSFFCAGSRRVASRRARTRKRSRKHARQLHSVYKHNLLVSFEEYYRDCPTVFFRGANSRKRARMYVLRSALHTHTHTCAYKKFTCPALGKYYRHCPGSWRASSRKRFNLQLFDSRRKFSEARTHIYAHTHGRRFRSAATHTYTHMRV